MSKRWFSTDNLIGSASIVFLGWIVIGSSPRAWDFEAAAPAQAQKPPILASSAISSVVARGQTFTCTPVAVWDGDGPIWCAEGPRIRIAGVAAREIDNSCSPGHPCPRVSGIEARDRLVRLFGGAIGTLGTGHIKVTAPAMTCISDGSAGGNRTAAWCRSPVFGDLSCAVVKAGGALPWQRYWRDHRCQ